MIMKRIFFTAALLLAGLAAGAQSFSERYEDFNEKYNNEVVHGSNVDLSLFEHLGFGWSMFNPGENVLDLKMNKSFSFAMDMVNLDVRLSDAFHLRGALRWTFENYVPESAIVYTNTGNAISVAPALDLKKSKMRADYLGIPVGFAVKNGHYTFYANAIGEILTKSITKWKTGKGQGKEVIKGYEPLRAAVEAGVEYRKLGIFVRYTLTPSFSSSSLLGDDRLLTVGIGLEL